MTKLEVETVAKEVRREDYRKVLRAMNALDRKLEAALDFGCDLDATSMMQAACALMLEVRTMEQNIRTTNIAIREVK